jgi:hypothetical protein
MARVKFCLRKEKTENYISAFFFLITGCLKLSLAKGGIYR